MEEREMILQLIADALNLEMWEVAENKYPCWMYDLAEKLVSEGWRKA